MKEVTWAFVVAALLLVLMVWSQIEEYSAMPAAPARAQEARK